MSRTSVAILGKSGMIGCHYQTILKDHPWFELTDKVEEAAIIFSALPNHVAEKHEPELAKQGHIVISSASIHRHQPIIPEINGSLLEKLDLSHGHIITKSNCTIQSFMLPLAPLHKQFKIRKIHVTTLQATSGAGKNYPSIEGNIIPYIEAEEEKVESEPLLIFGDPTIQIAAHCTRVPVEHGHLACVSVEFDKMPSRAAILELWNQPSILNLPSSPRYPVIYHEAPPRPQPLLDRDCGSGMSVSVGRLRPCKLLHWRFVCLSHNLKRGGAGTGLLIAEEIHAQLLDAQQCMHKSEKSPLKNFKLNKL